MNPSRRPPLLVRRMAGFFRSPGTLRTHLVVSAVFLLLFASFVFSLGRYWEHTLEPRLYLAAETQAKILAQSQAAALVQTLEHSTRGHLAKEFYDLVQEMLIVEDPAIGGRMLLGVALQIDYSAVAVEPGSLDLREGNTACEACFRASIPLINRKGELLGIAEFAVSNGYFHALSREMKSKLYAESSMALILLAAVWVAVLVMFHRLHAAKEAIEASDRAKTRFMANVTHELRTPLNAILGYTQLYKKDAALMATHGQGIETMDRSAEHLLLMINDILDFSRVDEENLSLHPREVGLAGFLNTLVEMTEVSARVKGIRFVHDFPAELPAAVAVDDKRLRQVLLNLLGNAIKFTEHGEVRLSVETLASSATSARLRFGVRDTGIGIDAGDLASIFIPFHQLDNPITRAEGSGLGLTISQRLVRLMGSQLKVESSPGQGSRFWFDLDLPLLKGGATETTAEPEAEAGPAEEVFELPPAETLNALLDQARRHNVLGVRALMKAVENEPRFTAFADYIRPFVRHYRFKQLAEWLATKGAE